ncbi:hypothetical protein BV20DRAFT_730268 [Pilatotrama ljubarskyi]|nr:hypothetical protein BV20DRAFT_730268 [Pilatotrama ljubarskyi]
MRTLGRKRYGSAMLQLGSQKLCCRHPYRLSLCSCYRCDMAYGRHGYGWYLGSRTGRTAEDAYAPYQSFLKALQTSGVLQEPESDEGGIIMYFALRAHENSPPQRRRRAQNKDVLQSWLAFNQWPSPYFYPEWSGIFSIPSRTGEWGVPLTSTKQHMRLASVVSMCHSTPAAASHISLWTSSTI